MEGADKPQSEKTEAEKLLTPGITAERCFAAPCITYETEGEINANVIIGCCCPLYTLLCWTPNPTPEYIEKVHKEYPHPNDNIV